MRRATPPVLVVPVMKARQRSGLWMRGIWIAVLVGVLLTPTGSYALPFVIRVVVDTSTPVPNGSGEFASFAAPAMSGGDIAFLGRDQAGQQGVYLAGEDGLVVVADSSTPIPGTTDTFRGLQNAPAISEGGVAFLGGPSGTGTDSTSGVYQWFDGEITKVADTHTPVPDGSGMFLDFETPGPSIDRGTVAFAGNSASLNGITGLNEGIYALGEGETLQRIIDVSEPAIPGLRILTDVGHPVVRNDEIVFEGTTALVIENPDGSLGLDEAQASLFLYSDGALEELIASGANGTSFLDDTIAIRDVLTLGTRILAFEDGMTRVVADASTEIPGGSGTFTVFNGGPWVTDDGIYFEGTWQDPEGNWRTGVFLDRDGALHPVLVTGDSLFEGIVADVDLLIGGYENDPDGVAFRVAFQDGTSALVIAMIPEPSTALLLATGLAGLAAAGRRRTKSSVYPGSIALSFQDE